MANDEQFGQVSESLDMYYGVNNAFGRKKMNLAKLKINLKKDNFERVKKYSKNLLINDDDYMAQKRSAYKKLCDLNDKRS